jgi:hypothetical protein
MVETFHGLAATRPSRKKFAKPPVKVACLPWCASSDHFVGATPANALLVALQELGVEGRNLAPTYVPVPCARFDCRLMHTNLSSVSPKAANAPIFPANEVALVRRSRRKRRRRRRRPRTRRRMPGMPWCPSSKSVCTDLSELLVFMSLITRQRLACSTRSMCSQRLAQVYGIWISQCLPCTRPTFLKTKTCLRFKWNPCLRLWAPRSAS